MIEATLRSLDTPGAAFGKATSFQPDDPAGHRWGRHLLIVPRWDLRQVETAIERLCAAAIGDDWSALATKIGRYGHWEFEVCNEPPFDPDAPSRSTDLPPVGRT